MRLLAGRDGPAGRDFVPDNVNCHDLAAVAVALFGEGVCSVRPIRRARVHCTNAASADRFAAEMSQHLGIIVERADTPARNLEDADVICTATPSSTPVFADNEVPPGAHINAVGAYRPGMVEIPTATIRRALVVVDHHAVFASVAESRKGGRGQNSCTHLHAAGHRESSAADARADLRLTD